MKKIHKYLKSDADFIARPFALRDHEHPEYVPVDKIGPIEVKTDLIFTGNIAGLVPAKPSIHVGTVVSALRMIATDDDGYGYYADPVDEDSVRRLLGMTISAGTSGQLISLHREGAYQDLFWNFDVTKRLFLGSNGTITQVAPTTGISVVLGHAQTADTIFLNMEKPIILA